jgi:hypothetical protein
MNYWEFEPEHTPCTIVNISIEEECWDCNGQGEIGGYQSRWGDGEVIGAWVCGTCGGAGTIEIEWMEELTTITTVERLPRKQIVELAPESEAA